MAKIIAIRKNDNSDKHIVGYMMNSLKNNKIDLTNENLIDILYNIESAKNRNQLFLIKGSNELTLLFGSLPNELFVLVFDENIWKEYFVYSHNYDSLKFFGNYNNPYINFIAKLDSAKSIIEYSARPYNKFEYLYKQILEVLKEDNLIHLMNRPDTDLFKSNLILDYLKDKLKY